MTANVDDGAAYPDPATLGGAPARGRELRAQGKRTMQRLLDAGLAVFAARGYHSTRVDDIVREARTSHGTFYLYFANKEDLLRALAGACVEDLEALAASVGRLGPGPDGEAALGAFLGRFLAVYRRYGPVIRAWTEGQVGDAEVDRLGVAAFTAIGAALAGHLDGAIEHPDVAVMALMAMIERFSFVVAASRVPAPDDVVLATLTRVVQRGFFAPEA
ncbi:MAG: helix-turn-helix domain-containing protein [Actinomycetes bacterium]